MKTMSLILLSLLFLMVSFVISAFIKFYKKDVSLSELKSDFTDENSKFIELNDKTESADFSGVKMHYRDEGVASKPALVMLHGSFGSLHNWHGWIKELKNDFRLISVDLLGHGLTGGYPDKVYNRHSGRDAVHELLQKIGVEKYTVAGIAFGGGIAVEIALKYPQEVEGLVLLASEGLPNTENGFDESIFRKVVSPEQAGYKKLSFGESITSKFIGESVVRSTLANMIHDKSKLTDKLVTKTSQLIRHEGNRKAQMLMYRQGLSLIYQTYQQGNQMDLLNRLNEIQCPTLVIHGEHDAVVPMYVSDTFANEIANAKLVKVDAGHLSMIEKPTETATAVRDFFKKQMLLAKEK